MYGRGPPGPDPGEPPLHVGPPAGPLQAPPPKVEEVQREKTCPLLLRVFPRHGGHHRLEEYTKRGQEPDPEIQIYTWPDASLRELTQLVKEVNPEARRPAARLQFAFVYPDRRGVNVMRQVGGVHATRPGEDDNKTLKQLAFQTGDFLDVAIY